MALAWLKITPRCQALLAERFFQQTSASDIAAKVGDTHGAVKRYMSRCLEKLRTFLGGRT